MRFLYLSKNSLTLFPEKKTLPGILFIILPLGQAFIIAPLVFLFLILGAVTGSWIAASENQLWITILLYAPLISMILSYALVIPTAIAGVALMTNRKWAMWPALITAYLNIISFPFGTMLGAYTI